MRTNLPTKILNCIIVLFTIAIVFVASCKKDEPQPCPPVICDDPTNPDCGNYDPCYTVEEVSADFDIWEQFAATATWADSFSIAKEVSSFGVIKFKAHQENLLQYTWYLGSEIITDVNEISRVFQEPNVTPGTQVSVTLVVQGIPNLDCFPNDNGTDTVTKTFKVVQPCDYWVDGTFRGTWADEQSTDSFDIITQFVDHQTFKCSNLMGSNFNNDMLCTNLAMADKVPTHSTRLTFEIGSTCSEPYGSQGVGSMYYYVENNSVKIDYVFKRWNPSTQTMDDSVKVFKGYRIN